MDHNKLQKTLEVFENRFDELNRKILVELANDMKKFKGLIPSQAYKLKQQLKNGRTVERIINELEKASNLTNEDIKTILEITANDNIDFANTYYKYRDLPTIDYSTSSYFKGIVNSVARTTQNEFKNLSRTTAFKLLDDNKNPVYLPIEKAYGEVIDRCVLAAQTGQMSYGEAIYDTINQLSSSGIKKIYYSNDGKRAYARRLDSSIRMNVLDGVRQLNMELQNRFDEDLGFDGKEITAHVPCAIDHQDIQGRQFSNEDYEELNNKLNRPIGTLNCTHFTFNIILGVSKPRYTNEELERMKKESNKKTEFQGKEYTKYEATQVQRKLETKLRDLKYKRDMLKIVDEPEQLTKVMKEITDTTKLYKDFSDKMGLEYKVNRTKPIKKNNNIKFKSDHMDDDIMELKKRDIHSYGDEIYNQFISNGYENLGIINNTTHKKIGNIVNSGLDYGVGYSAEQVELMKDYHRELTLIHTHPTNVSFSPEDIFEMFKNTALCDILVETPNYEYYLIPDKADFDDILNNLEDFQDWLYKTMGKIRDDNDNLNECDFRHLAYNKIFNERLKWRYGRNKK